MKPKNDNANFSKLLTPILLIGILLFAGLVTYASIVAYNREQENIENYTHARMKSLILDLETKLVATESSLMTISHGRNLAIEDSTRLYTRLEDFLEDQDFVCLAGFDFGGGDNSLVDGSDMLFASKLSDGSIMRGNVFWADSAVSKTLIDCYNEAFESYRPVWSHPYYDEVMSRSNVVTCYVRAENNTTMLCADIELNALLKTIDSLQFYPESRMYIDVPGGDIYTLENGKLINVDEIKADNDKYTTIAAHYRHLDLNIINVVPNEMIFSTLWKKVAIIFLIFLFGLIVIALHVHRAFIKAQENLALSISKSHEEELALKKYEEEISIAAQIQSKMLTAPGCPMHLVPEEGRPVDIMTRIIPAREVGGDLYEYRLQGNYLVVCVGDVSGKGVPAAIVMSKCSTLFHAYVSNNSEPDPSVLLGQLNEQLCRRNDNLMFVTMWIGVLDLRNGHLKYSSAGHNPPVLVGNGASRFMELCQGLPLGMFKDNEYPLHECDLDASETLVLYTDGITEAENSKHELFGDDRLLEVCSESESCYPESLCHSILKAVFTHASGCRQSDDITLLCFSFGNTCAQLHGIEDIQAIHTLISNCKESDEAALVLEEAAVNSFRHGGASFVFVEYTDGLFYLVSDGDDFDPTKYKIPALADGELRVGGRGIPLIRQLCSETTYHRTRWGINIQTFKLNKPQ